MSRGVFVVLTKKYAANIMLIMEEVYWRLVVEEIVTLNLISK